MRNRIVIGIWFMLSIVTSNLVAKPNNFELYVSPSGNDSNLGTFDKPLLTLEAARNRVRKVKQASNVVDRDIVVYLREGCYPIDETFVLSEKDSGQKNSRIVYRNYKNEKVNLIGAKVLSSTLFKPVSDKSIAKRLGSAACKNILEIDLKSLNINDYGVLRQIGHSLQIYPAPMELFFNSQVMTLARYPNSGYILIGDIVDKGSVPRKKDYSNRGAIFKYTDERHSLWSDVNDIWLRGTFMYGYADDQINVKRIDPIKHQIELMTPHMYGVGTGKPFRHYVAVNILEELDEPGEWYLNRKSGKLYFWPPSDVENSNIGVSLLEEPIVSIEGASYVTMQGLTIEMGRGIGIYMERGSDNIIAGCTIRNMGTTGIFMGQGAKQTFPYITHDDYEGVPVSRKVGSYEGHIYKHTTWDRKAGENNRIVSCDIYNTGCGGIVLSGGSKKDLIPGNCSVINCKIYNYNRRNKNTWAGVKVDGCGNRVAHCEIFNSDFQAIYARGNEHVFEYNYIHNVAKESDDVSAWYMGRDPSDRGNIIRYNLFYDIGRNDRSVMGVYFDDATCGAGVYGNIFYNISGYSIFSNAGQDIKIENNIFVGCKSAFLLSSFFYTWGKNSIPGYFDDSGIYVSRLKHSVDITSPPYSVKYPELVDILEPIPNTKNEYVLMRPRRNVFKRNIICSCKESLVLKGPYAQCKSIDNYITDQHPEFKDINRLNFEFKDDSIYKNVPHFEKIPFEKMGLYVDGFRLSII